MTFHDAVTPAIASIAALLIAFWLIVRLLLWWDATREQTVGCLDGFSGPCCGRWLTDSSVRPSTRRGRRTGRVRETDY